MDGGPPPGSPAAVTAARGVGGSGYGDISPTFPPGAGGGHRPPLPWGSLEWGGLGGGYVTAELLLGRRSPQRRRGVLGRGGDTHPQLWDPGVWDPPCERWGQRWPCRRASGGGGRRSSGGQSGVPGGGRPGQEPCPDTTGKGSHPWEENGEGGRLSAPSLGSQGRPCAWGWLLLEIRAWGGGAKLGGCTPFLLHHPCVGGRGRGGGQGERLSPPPAKRCVQRVMAECAFQWGN